MVKRDSAFVAWEDAQRLGPQVKHNRIPVDVIVFGCWFGESGRARHTTRARRRTRVKVIHSMGRWTS